MISRFLLGNLSEDQIGMILNIINHKSKIELDFSHLLSYNAHKLQDKIKNAKNLIKEDEESQNIYLSLCDVFNVK